MRPPGRVVIGSSPLGRLELLYPPNSGSGGETAALTVAILSQVFRVHGLDTLDELEVYHATVEALKFAFAHRAELNETSNDKDREETLVSGTIATTITIISSITIILIIGTHDNECCVILSACLAELCG